MYVIYRNTFFKKYGRPIVRIFEYDMPDHETMQFRKFYTASSYTELVKVVFPEIYNALREGMTKNIRAEKFVYRVLFGTRMSVPAPLPQSTSLPALTGLFSVLLVEKKMREVFVL